MNQLSALKTVSLVTLTAAATSLLIQACGGGAMAQTAADADPIEGVWESSVTIKDCILRFNPDGSLAGSQKIQRSVTLAADGTTFTATVAAQVIDLSGVVLQPICGSETAVRIY